MILSNIEKEQIARKFLEANVDVDPKQILDDILNLS
jgi:hypothetical protein